MTRHNDKEVKRLGWVLTGLIIFEVVFFTTINPEALNPYFVAILTGLLITVKAIYGIEGSDDEERTDQGITGRARKTAKKLSQKVVDSLEDSNSTKYDQQDDNYLRIAWYVRRWNDCPTC